MRTESARTIPLTSEHREKIEALQHCTMTRTWDRVFTRFLGRLPDGYPLSPKQTASIDSLYRSYGDQIAAQTENVGRNTSPQTN